jgi:hypothetical protein
MTNNVAGNPRQGEQYTVRQGNGGVWHDYTDGTHIFVRNKTTPVAAAPDTATPAASAPIAAAPTATSSQPQPTTDNSGAVVLTNNTGNARDGQQYTVVHDAKKGGDWHIYANGTKVFVDKGGGAIGETDTSEMFGAGLGIFPHASNYHKPTSVSVRSAGAIVGGEFGEPLDRKQTAGGWATSTAEAPQDPTAGAIAAAGSGSLDNDPLEIKNDKHQAS